jgi:predicted AAA+ superfamily ATPase
MQVVTGARQVGKTTLVTQIVERARLPYVFASADEPTLRGSAWIDAQWEAARLLLRDTGQGGALLVLDEVQKVSHWNVRRVLCRQSDLLASDIRLRYRRLPSRLPVQDRF